MKLENITAEIRPRSAWEAVDLGCALARRDFWKIVRALAVTTLPLLFVIIGLLHNYLAWTVIAVWWLKPLSDRVSLHYLSQSLFGAPPSLKSTLKEWPRIIARFLLRDWSTLIVAVIIILAVTDNIEPDTAITITVLAVFIFILTSLATRKGRFLPWRSFLLPLTELEHLQGKQYAARSKILFRRGSEEATWLALTCFIMEFAVALGMLFLFLTFIPQGQETDTERIIAGLASFQGEDVPDYILWIIVSLYLLATTIVSIFYTGGGFGLYLNSRTLLEGWDVELSFRKLASRVGLPKTPSPQTVATATFALSSFFFFGITAQAPAEDSSNPSPAKTIKSILADDDFTVHTETVRTPITESREFDFDLPNFNVLSGLVQLLFWAVVLVFIGAVAYLIYQNRHIFTASGRATAKEKNLPKASTLMGMNVTPETLPNDIAQAAREAWLAGRRQEALSYLYRGAICWFIERENLPVHESDTEGDCVRLAERLPNKSHSRYFAELTNEWSRLVYAKLPLDDKTAHRLFDQWPFDLRSPTISP
ncbi:MAG: hypothetical protein AAGD22_15325 [Verrucomicrobiota bacterium]